MTHAAADVGDISAPYASDPPARPAPANAAGRLLAVLDAFDQRHRSLSLSDISRRAGLSLSTTHRLVAELVNWRALERDADGRYSMGLRLFELAALAPRGLGLRDAAFPYLDELHHRTRGNVHLGVRDGSEVIYVETITARALRRTASHMGDRFPMHATGTGLVLLAHADRETQEEVLRQPLKRYTPLTVIEPMVLRRMLRQIRRSGVAVARGAITLPDLVVAVPVFDPLGEVAAAVSVVVDAETSKPAALTAMLRDVSRAISHKLSPHGLGGLAATSSAG